jgi:class 3 adenylate cyclase/tetratricopeptide (TPR) repeat protein/ribosomal protein L40E
MRCSKCNNDNPIDAAFCEGCGSKLEAICSSCGAPVNPGARFCKKCGTALAFTKTDGAPVSSGTTNIRVARDDNASEVVDGERKTVTALFADIKGSTEMMEDLDPEAARAVIDPALKLMMDAVHRYDGYVVQSTGDGIFALFGAPLAHEDHPQRALHAALRMQKELQRYSAKVVADGGTPLQGRIGINTGEVVVRSIHTGAGHVEYTPIGHMTNLASRMQTAAPVGSIAVTEATRKLCEGYFILKPLGRTRVKGVTEPVHVYEVTGLGPIRTRLQRAAGRGLVRFVGRQREMDAMKHAAEQARAGHGQIVAAMAEAGVGKSRLLFEFKAVSQSGWMVLEAFSVSHGKASAYLPLIDLLHSYFEIGSDDDSRRRRQKILGKLLELDRALEDTVAYLYALLGIVEGEDPLVQMDAQIKKRRTFEAIKRLLLRESLNQPVMVIFEDLHWIDDQTQEFLNLLADSIGTAKILLLVNYRPEYSHHWNSKTYYTQLRLDPLGKESAEEMLSSMLGDSKDLVPLKSLIIERTEGNPFFMEETVEVLLDDGALVRNGSIRLVKPLVELRIPPTVQDILASRIDRLGPAEKDLLQTLAVIGRDFGLGLLQRLITRPPDELNGMLHALQLAEFIYEQPAAGDIEYTFKHALTQEVASKSLLVERRKALHERVGLALEALFAQSIDDHLGELAHHFARSGNSEKAVEFLRRAAVQSLRRSAYREAAAYLNSAIDLVRSAPESAARTLSELILLNILGQVTNLFEGWQSAKVERTYARAVELAERVDDPIQTLAALTGKWSIHLIRGEMRIAIPLAERIREYAESSGDRVLSVASHFPLGNSLFQIGDFARSYAHAEQGLAAYSAEVENPGFWVGDVSIFGYGYSALSSWCLGYPDRALATIRKAVAHAERTPQKMDLFFVLGVTNDLSMWSGDIEAVRRYSETVARIGEEQGFTSGFLSIARARLGWVRARNGDLRTGLGEVAAALAKVEEPRDAYAATSISLMLADAYRLGRERTAGLGVVQRLLSFIEQTGVEFLLAPTYQMLGDVQLVGEDPDAEKAAASFRAAIRIARNQQAKSWELRATMSLARLLAKQGHREEARRMLADIYGWFTEGFDTADLTDARALLEELGAT